MKTVFLFPGQGAQFTGMAIDLLESVKVKTLFETASDILKRDMKSLLENSDTETLMRTDNSQPAITLANLAAFTYLQEKNIKPDGCAGFSLGEYSALAAAGVITIEDCFLMIGQRGRIMQSVCDKLSASQGEPPGMAAVIGLVPEEVESLIQKQKLEDLYAANLNSPKQTVISGTAAALKEAAKLFIESGAKRVIPLKVAGPFHSLLMAEAAAKFEIIIEKVSFNDPVMPFYSNVSGREVKSGAEAKKLALSHIMSPVRWTDEEKSISEFKPDRILEAGPGKVLQGLWKDSGIDIPCFGAGTAAEINNLV